MFYHRQEEEGQGLVEYALLLIMISVAVIAVAALLGPAIVDLFDNVMIAMTPLAPN